MKVIELIQKLNNFPAGKEVKVRTPEDDYDIEFVGLDHGEVIIVLED